MSRLHITNGDSAADILKVSGMGGDVLPWRDPMHHGPFPLDLDLDAVSDLRAKYLNGPHGDHDKARRFQSRNDCLRKSDQYDEVILWFEHDLLDQLQILQILDWFSNAPMAATRLTLICIDHFHGVEPFRGLGQLNPEQMVSLLSSRHPVTGTQLALASAGWAAFRSPDPTALETFLSGDLTPLQFLRAALVRHLEEFPWSSDGLTRTERQVLSLVSEGIAAPGRIFAANMDRETVLFEGDLRTFQHIADLANASQPLLHSKPYGRFRLRSNETVSRDDFLGQRLTLTAVGHDVVLGRTDAWSLIHRDEWLGGTHLLTGLPMWTWNAGDGRLRLRSE